MKLNAAQAKLSEALAVLAKLETLGNQRKAKITLLTEHKDNVCLQEMFRLAYDWQTTFGLRVPFYEAGAQNTRVKPIFGGNAQAQPPWAEFTDLLLKFSERSLTGNAAKEAWANAASEWSEQERVWFTRVLNRDMKVGIESAVDVVWPDLIKPFGVQLANEMKEDELAVPTKKEPWRVWPVAVQAKLDGMRVIIDYNATTAAAQAFSREGHLLERIQPLVDLLADHFEATGAPTCRVDCEAFLRDWNTTLSLVKKEDVPEADRLKLRFYCFDVIREIPDDPAPYRERYSHLQKLLKGAPEQYVTLATAESSDMDSLMAVYNEMLDQGHEGVMVKYWAAPYRAKRTSAWLKLKPTQTIDAEIVDFDPGKDGSKYRHSLGAFVVKRHDTGAVVRVGGGLSDKDREAFWAKKDSLLGKTIEFKEQGARGQVAKTSFPRFLRLREDR